MSVLTNNLTARQWSFDAEVLEAFSDARDEIFGNVCTNRLVFELDHSVLKGEQNTLIVSIHFYSYPIVRQIRLFKS